MHVALLDSTGWGLLSSRHDSSRAVRVGQCTYVVSPGASRHGAGERPGQLSLVQAVAREETGLLQGFFASTLPLRVIAIKTEDSIDISQQKQRKRFKI